MKKKEPENRCFSPESGPEPENWRAINLSAGKVKPRHRKIDQTVINYFN